jgi:hypothetical protein
LRFTNVKNMVASFFSRDINTYNCCHSRNSSYSDTFENRSHSPISHLKVDIRINRYVRNLATYSFNLL